MSRAARLTKTNITLGVATLLLVASGGMWFFKPDKAQPRTETTHAVASTQTKPAATDYVTYQGETNKTALELLKQHANVKTSNSEYGEFVSSVNGNDGGGKKYWVFFVDGTMASVGAGEYVTKEGEKIEWKLQ